MEERPEKTHPSGHHAGREDCCVETSSNGQSYPHGRPNRHERSWVVIPPQEWTEEQSWEIDQYLRQVWPSP
jgi:hypothetical protein